MNVYQVDLVFVGQLLLELGYPELAYLLLVVEIKQNEEDLDLRLRVMTAGFPIEVRRLTDNERPHRSVIKLKPDLLINKDRIVLEDVGLLVHHDRILIQT